MERGAGKSRRQKDERLNLRITAEEKRLLQQAALATHVSTSQFVLQAALRSAEETLVGRTGYVIPTEAWERLVALLDRPARTIPSLAEAARRSPSPREP